MKKVSLVLMLVATVVLVAHIALSFAVSWGYFSDSTAVLWWQWTPTICIVMGTLSIPGIWGMIREIYRYRKTHLHSLEY